MSQATNNLAAYIWSLADLLRGDFKQSQYGRIILPFTLLRRLELVLAPTKEAILAKHQELVAKKYSEEAIERQLLYTVRKLSGNSDWKFVNTSKLDLSKLGQSSIKANLDAYIHGFTSDAREIFEYFKFSEFLSQLDEANLLYLIVQRVRKTDLSPEKVSNHEMGLVFEELIRRFAESSNETAGEHFTPRDIVRLTTSLVFTEDDRALRDPDAIRTIYDPTAGTGGFLSSGMEYVHELNPEARMRAFGQELNPESFAICKADMMIKGQDVSNIKLGNTLSGDQLLGQHFDYLLSNPPFGVDWKKIENDIKDEHRLKGFDGRFGPGLPRVSDGSLLFLLHLISKMRPSETDRKEGARIGIILNGSPLFTGSAGSGESEIRRYVLENDLLEAIVALPTDMFYNTGIATYIWILTNKKSAQRKGKVQLINAVHLYGKMRKSLGSKRNVMSETDVERVTQTFGSFASLDPIALDKPAEVKSNRGRQGSGTKHETAKTFASKIFDNHEFGYRRITVERPLRQSYQFSDERIETLRFAPKPLNAPMQSLVETFGAKVAEQLDEKHQTFRKHLKRHFPELKEKKLKELLSPSTWREQAAILAKAKQLQEKIGKAQYDDMNGFAAAIKASGIKLDTAEKKQITAAVSWTNPDAERVIKKVHKGAKAAPLYGLFEVDGKVVEFQTDSDLRDHENVALDPSQTVKQSIEAYFAKEVQPHVADTWIDANKVDARDGEIGIVGYEIPFNRHFYEYQPPRSLEEIDCDLDAVSAEIMQLLQEVHS
jgi:type I restriction enzyme M protein